MEQDVVYIYLKMLKLEYCIPVLYAPTPISCFLGGLLLTLTTAYNIIVLVSGYRSKYMHCIVVPVKFDGGLFISTLRNKQLFTKKWVSTAESRYLRSRLAPVIEMEVIEMVSISFIE
jgi:hypothetical protein